MPRYTLHTTLLAEPDVRMALEIARRRFPEIDVELAEPSDPRIWTCRAPDETHLRRWVAASAIEVEDIIALGAHHDTPDHQLDNDTNNEQKGHPPCTHQA